jgi:DnaK suppressor protein
LTAFGPENPAALTRLEAERVLVTDQLAGLRRGFQAIVDASTDSNGDDEHDPEGSTIAFERSQVKALIQQAESHLNDIEDARMKVAQGRYGVCEACGGQISEARLDARPVARTCIACAAIAR